MENELQKKLEENLLQLREELIEVKRLLHMCKVGFEAIQETGNSKVADVFLDELNSNL
mgnify:FL=1